MISQPKPWTPSALSTTTQVFLNPELYTARRRKGDGGFQVLRLCVTEESCFGIRWKLEEAFGVRVTLRETLYKGDCKAYR